MKRAIIVLLILFSLTFALEQPTPPEHGKNVIYATGGIFITFYYNILLNYERVIWEPHTALLNSLSVRGGAGWWETWVSSGSNYLLTLSAMSGKRSLHMEYGLGLCYSPDYFNELKILPAANLGFRYQKPGHSLVIRAGAGLPEFAYVSVGYAF